MRVIQGVGHLPDEGEDLRRREHALAAQELALADGLALDDAALAQYAAIMKRQEAVLFRGTGRGYS